MFRNGLHLSKNSPEDVFAADQLFYPHCSKLCSEKQFKRPALFLVFHRSRLAQVRGISKVSVL
jgi:hypothetical protein